MRYSSKNYLLTYLLLPLDRWKQKFFPGVGAMHVAGPKLRRQAVALAVEQQQRMITGGLEVIVVGALLLLAVDRDLGGIHIQNHPSGRIDAFHSADQFAVDPCQTGEVLLPGQHLGLEGLQPGRQGGPALPDLLRADEPEGRILAQPLRVVDILVTSQAAVDRLPQQVGEGKLGVLPRPGNTELILDELAEAETLVQLANQNQAAVGGDS